MVHKNGIIRVIGVSNLQNNTEPGTFSLFRPAEETSSHRFDQCFTLVKADADSFVFCGMKWFEETLFHEGATHAGTVILNGNKYRMVFAIECCKPEMVGVILYHGVERSGGTGYTALFPERLDCIDDKVFQNI